jgi:SAM-dependent methyltransferase
MSKTDKELKVNLGCGVVLISGFLNIDKYYTYEQLRDKEGIFCNAITPDDAGYLQADACDLPLADNIVDYLETVDMIEHIPFRELPKVFSEIARVLKPNGVARLMTTNFDNLAQLWVDHMIGKEYNEFNYYEITQLIYGNQQYGGEFHVSPFNPAIIRHYLETAGLTVTEITILPYGTSEQPKDIKTIRTQVWEKDWLMRSDMMWVKAEKLLLAK